MNNKQLVAMRIRKGYKSYKKRDLCPICNCRFNDIEHSFDICDYHLNWFVSKCVFCGKYVFTDAIGVCYSCYNF